MWHEDVISIAGQWHHYQVLCTMIEHLTASI